MRAIVTLLIALMLALGAGAGTTGCSSHTSTTTTETVQHSPNPDGTTTTEVTNQLAFARRAFRRIVLERLRRICGSEREFRAEVRAILENAVKPESRVKLGSLLADIGRRAGLSEDDVATFGLRDRSPGARFREDR